MEEKSPDSSAPSDSAALYRPVSGVQFFAGVILPFICLVFSFPDQPAWQSGRPQAYAQLFLSHIGSLLLYPFLLYNMACMTMLFVKPAKFREKAWVRFGIYSGVLVAAEFWILFQIALTDSSMIRTMVLSLLAAVVPWGIWRFISFLLPEFRRWIVGVAIVLVLVCLLVVWPLVVFGGLWCSTPWALASYLIAAVRLIRGRSETRFRFSLAQLVGFVSWFAAHCSAWRLSYICVIEAYSLLPTHPPQGCFVCSAVAKGHRRVVRGEVYLAANGTACVINDQLRVLKALELLLLSLSPKGHRACRRIYDRIGPRLAATLVHPTLADAGYFALKPLEWLALACLRVAIPGKSALVYRMYSNSRTFKPKGGPSETSPTIV